MKDTEPCCAMSKSRMEVASRSQTPACLASTPASSRMGRGLAVQRREELGAVPSAPDTGEHCFCERLRTSVSSSAHTTVCSQRVGLAAESGQRLTSNGRGLVPIKLYLWTHLNCI